MSGLPSARSRVAEVLDRITSENDSTCIFINVRGDQALADAADSDSRCAAGSARNPLEGRMVGVKDNIAVQGLASTLGFGCFRNRTADADANVVARLKAAGAIVIGTLNMHEGALGATTDNPHFGRCINPLQHDLTPGGSSGGSAAAVASGLVDFALGTDTMGSVRLPAAYCGIVGFKPSRGAVGRSGLGYLSPTLDTIGPLATTVTITTAVFAAMLGPDPGDPDWTGLDNLNARDDAPVDFSRLCFGVPKQLADVAIAPDVQAAFNLARSTLVSAGLEICDIDLNGWSPPKARRAGLLVSEAEAAKLWPTLLDERQQGVSGAFKAMLRFGRDVAATKLADAFAEMRHSAAALDRASRQVDAILMPTAPQRPFHHGQNPPVNQADLTALANFAGAPAIALPYQCEGEALPDSLQLVARPGDDARLLRITAAIEQLFQGRMS